MNENKYSFLQMMYYLARSGWTFGPDATSGGLAAQRGNFRWIFNMYAPEDPAHMIDMLNAYGEFEDTGVVTTVAS